MFLEDNSVMGIGTSEDPASVASEEGTLYLITFTAGAGLDQRPSTATRTRRAGACG